MLCALNAAGVAGRMIRGGASGGLDAPRVRRRCLFRTNKKLVVLRARHASSAIVHHAVTSLALCARPSVDSRSSRPLRPRGIQLHAVE